MLGFLIVVNVVVFLLAFFLDFFELSFIIVPLLGPVAEKLGIDLIWFGVLLAVNMQTSFMHPPFGFALFYLRSVAPMKEYLDKLTGKIMAPVTTMQIYWGAVPYVIIQVIMIGLVILFPQMVMVYKSEAPTVDPSKIQIDLPTMEQETPPAIEIPGADKSGDPAKAGTGKDAGKSGDPLQDMLKQQEDDSAKANKSLEDAFKQK